VELLRNRYAITTRSICNRYGIAARSLPILLCYRFASDMKALRNRYAIVLQSPRDRFGIAM
jgi:hypothetical protein